MAALGNTVQLCTTPAELLASIKIAATGFHVLALMHFVTFTTSYLYTSTSAYSMVKSICSMASVSFY